MWESLEGFEDGIIVVGSSGHFVGEEENHLGEVDGGGGLIKHRLCFSCTDRLSHLVKACTRSSASRMPFLLISMMPKASLNCWMADWLKKSKMFFSLPMLLCYIQVSPMRME